MLLELRLRGLGVIRDAVLDLGPGLTVVTGETGAGKTMVVSGLGLLMGLRADAGAVRQGEPAAVVEGRLQLDPDGPAAARAGEAGAHLDDGDVLVIARTVSAEGRSRAHVGGRAAPVGLLAELAEDLVAVHGQSEQLRLRSASRQREALDRFAGAAVTEDLQVYRTGWARLRAAQAELAELTERARDRSAEAELLRLGLAEIERVAPQPGEDAELRAEALRLAHAEELAGAAGTARALLSGEPGDATADPAASADAAAVVDGARRALDGVREHDPALAALADRLGELGYLLADLAAEVAGYGAGLESDPARLAAVEDRRAQLGQLTRAYGQDVAAVLEWARGAGLRLLELAGDGDRLETLRAEHAQLRERLTHLGGQISAERSKAADRLAGDVTAELAELAMPGAALLVQVSPGTELGPDGIDEVEFLLAAHPGAPARPLARGASGGELSRLMLGLEVTLGAADPVPTFVFDEVDAGVGGEAALGIGRRLARLAGGSQVLVVTHLAQVAAFADRHLVVVKSSDGDVTEAGVRRLDPPGRVRELARMLGGVADSGTAQAHAEELLQLARGTIGT